MQLHPLNNETGILSPSATTMRYVIWRPLIPLLPGHCTSLSSGANDNNANVSHVGQKFISWLMIKATIVPNKWISVNTCRHIIVMICGSKIRFDFHRSLEPVHNPLWEETAGCVSSKPNLNSYFNSCRAPGRQKCKLSDFDVNRPTWHQHVQLKIFVQLLVSFLQKILVLNLFCFT